MNVRKPCLCAALVVVMLTTAMLVGCPKKAEPPPDTSALPQPPDTTEVQPPEVAEPAASEVVLTKALLDQWLACAKDESIRKIADDLDTETTGDDPASMKAAIEGMAANAQLEEAVKAHGFASAQEWAAVTLKVMVGMFNATLAEATEQMAEMGDVPQVQEAKAEMEKQAAEFREALGELSAEEQQLIDGALDDLKNAMDEEEGSGGGAAE
jgi:hypothetical protein